MEMIKEFLEKQYLGFLYRSIHFERWHLDRANKRPYAAYLIKQINSMGLSGKVVEIGCGLGDILSGIQVKDKIGYDVDRKVIRAAKWVHPFLKTKVGSFRDIYGQEISLLIAVNFLFALEDDKFQRCFKAVTARNHIDRIVVDEVPCPPYGYAHDYIGFLKTMGYQLEYKSRGFAAVGGRRYLLFFRRTVK